MNENNFLKPKNPTKNEPIKIEVGLDIKIKKLLARQSELMEALEKSYDVLEILDDDPEAQQLERENIAPLRQEYLENKKILGELYEKYSQIKEHRGFNADAFLKAVFESSEDNK